MANLPWIFFEKKLETAGKSGKLIVIGIHFVAENILAAEFKFDVHRINGTISRSVLLNIEEHGRR